MENNESLLPLEAMNTDNITQVERKLLTAKSERSSSGVLIETQNLIDNCSSTKSCSIKSSVSSTGNVQTSSSASPAKSTSQQFNSSAEGRCIYDSIKALDDEENWRERVVVLTKRDHEDYVDIAGDIINDLVLSLPVQSTDSDKLTEANDGSSMSHVPENMEFPKIDHFIEHSPKANHRINLDNSSLSEYESAPEDKLEGDQSCYVDCDTQLQVDAVNFGRCHLAQDDVLSSSVTSFEGNEPTNRDTSSTDNELSKETKASEVTPRQSLCNDGLIEFDRVDSAGHDRDGSAPTTDNNTAEVNETDTLSDCVERPTNDTAAQISDTSVDNHCSEKVYSENTTELEVLFENMQVSVEQTDKESKEVENVYPEGIEHPVQDEFEDHHLGADKSPERNDGIHSEVSVDDNQPSGCEKQSDADVQPFETEDKFLPDVCTVFPSVGADSVTADIDGDKKVVSVMLFTDDSLNFDVNSLSVTETGSLPSKKQEETSVGGESDSEIVTENHSESPETVGWNENVTDLENEENMFNENNETVIDKFWRETEEKNDLFEVNSSADILPQYDTETVKEQCTDENATVADLDNVDAKEGEESSEDSGIQIFMPKKITSTVEDDQSTGVNFSGEQQQPVKDLTGSNIHEIDGKDNSNFGKCSIGPVTDDEPKSIEDSAPNQSEAGPEVAEFSEDEFKSAVEFFKDPGAFDFLQKAGSSKTFENSALARMSLYVKFDPLVKPGSPGVKSRRDTIQSSNASKNSDNLLPPGQSGNELIAFSPKQTKTKPEPDYLGTTISEARVPPRMNIANKSSETTNLNDSMKTFTEEELNKALKLQELLFQEKLLKKDKHSGHQLNKLQMKLKTFEESRNAMTKVVAEYEKTISELISDIENFKDSTIQLQTERDTALDDLKSVENAFADLYKRFEKTKLLVDETKKSKELYADKVKKTEQKLELVKKYAEETLENANLEIENQRKSLEVYKAQLKKSEMKVNSLERAIETKDKDYDELSNICDDLIAKVGHS